jgi:hypothetical protein
MASVRRKSLEAQLHKRVRVRSDDIEDVEDVFNDSEVPLSDDGSSNFSSTENERKRDIDPAVRYLSYFSESFD